jgi:predicted transcriptional regulator
MEVDFPPELEIQLQMAAADIGKTPQEFVQDSIRDMLQGRAEFIKAVQQGALAADRGEFVDHEEVTRELNRLFLSH